MAHPNGPNGKRNVALKLTDDVHTKLAILAQLKGTTVPDEIRFAIGDYLTSQRSSLAERASEVRAEIERATQERLATIDALFGEPDTAADAASAVNATKGRNGGARRSRGPSAS